MQISDTAFQVIPTLGLFYTLILTWEVLPQEAYREGGQKGSLNMSVFVTQPCSLYNAEVPQFQTMVWRLVACLPTVATE
jgi:hypothetical protein